MRKLSLVGLCAALAVAGAGFTAHVASAKDFSKLTVTVSDNINKDCGQPDGYDALRGCYVQSLNPGDAAPATKIFIRSGLPLQLLDYTLLYEIGHFIAYNYSEEYLKTIFNPAPDKLAADSIRNVAAEDFVMWFYRGHVSVPQANFFKEALLSK